MKKTRLFTVFTLLSFMATSVVSAANVGSQASSPEGKANAPEISGDGIQNASQDEDFGDYGYGETTGEPVGKSPNELSGDGIPNSSQDEEFGQYGGNTGGEVMDGIGRGYDTTVPGEQVKTKNTGEDIQVQAKEQIQVGELAGTAFPQDMAKLMSVENGPRFGSESENISQLGTEVLTTLLVSQDAETKMQERSGFTRFFFGGDDDSVEQITKLSEQNLIRITEMNRILTSCDADCDGELKVELAEQLQLAEAEQTRLNASAVKESESKGVFGWLFGWL